MKVLIIFFLFIILFAAGAYADNGMLALFTDSNASDCDVNIGLYEDKSIQLFYVRGDGPIMGDLCNFRLRLSTQGAAFLSPTWSQRVIASSGDLVSGMTLVFHGCLGEVTKHVGDYAYIGTIPVFCLSDTDTFSVSVVGNPNTSPSGLLVKTCESDSFISVNGGTFVFNGCLLYTSDAADE